MLYSLLSKFADKSCYSPHDRGDKDLYLRLATISTHGDPRKWTATILLREKSEKSRNPILENSQISTQLELRS